MSVTRLPSHAILLTFSFFFHRSAHHRHLHSFPTRRSSDLFVEIVGREAATCGRFDTAVIGPVTAATARELGLTVAVEAVEYTVPGLVRALVQYFGEGGRGKRER